jgi:hypothetical protein
MAAIAERRIALARQLNDTPLCSSARISSCRAARIQKRGTRLFEDI